LVWEKNCLHDRRCGVFVTPFLLETKRATFFSMSFLIRRYSPRDLFIQHAISRKELVCTCRCLVRPDIRRDASVNQQAEEHRIMPLFGGFSVFFCSLRHSRRVDRCGTCHTTLNSIPVLVSFLPHNDLWWQFLVPGSIYCQGNGIYGFNRLSFVPLQTRKVQLSSHPAVC
jgi:hypothetical protein